MNNYNYHPARWYAATVATLASFSLWFTWTKVMEQNLYFIGETTKNGYNDWGFLTIAGIVGVFVATFIGDKMKPFDQQSRLIACASFGIIALGGIITMATATKTGPGPWVAIVLGAIGIILASGIIKIPDSFPSSVNQSPTSNITPPGPPPTPGAIPPTPGSIPPPPPPPSK